MVDKAVTIPALCREIKKQIASATKSQAAADSARDRLETLQVLADVEGRNAERAFREAGHKLIQLRERCAAEKISFERTLATHKVGVSKNRAYELIRIAGGIPGKIMARSLADTRDMKRDQVRDTRDRKLPSRVVYDPDTIRDRGGNVLPWPADLKRPVAPPGSPPLIGKAPEDDAEFLTGVTLNRMREAMRLSTVMPDPTKVTNPKLLAQTARRVARAWDEVADLLEKAAHEAKSGMLDTAATLVPS